MAQIFPVNLKVRAEPGLREALAAAAREEKTTAAEFIRRELRDALARRQVASREPASARAAA